MGSSCTVYGSFNLKSFFMRKLSFIVIVMYIAITSNVIAQNKKTIEFEHLSDGTFSPESIQNFRWMQDGQFYSATKGRQIIQYDILDGSETILFDGGTFVSTAYPNGIDVQGYEFSADEQLILIKTDVEQLWRRSTKENYFVYTIADKSLKQLTETEGKQQYAQLSPKGDKAAFVRDNNLFWVDLTTGKETQITTDGEFNKIINGASDWVYEEEFGFAKAWFWSPKGDKIAFYRFDEERVKEFFLTEWGTLYLGQTRFKYPKAGEDNSIVSIHVYDVNSKALQTMDVGTETDQYIPRIKWTRDNNLLAIRRMNRLQTKEELLFANATTGQTKVILTEESDSWIDVQDNLIFLKNGVQFITTSEKDGYNHAYLYDMKGNNLRQITSGNWEITKIIGYNEKSYTLFYESTEVSPLQRHVYRVRVDGNKKTKYTSQEGWNKINFSRDFKYYVLTYSDYNKPPVATLYDENRKKIRVIEDNAALLGRLKEYAYSPKEFMQLQINGATLNAYMIKPVGFDSTKKYPALFYVYGGPGSQTVTREFESGQRPMWHQYLANQGYIIVSVDNRGTGARGRDFEKQVYKILGQYESADQIEAAKQIAQLPFVDETRIGIWGWSYGGYMSSLCIALGNDVFKTAIAVAPVTYWGFYDTIYTERFMQTPRLNHEGYLKGSPLAYADQIKGNYLLVHGTGDDNVHFENAVEMVNALVAGDVQFQTMYYPNRNHGIYGGNTRKHLFRLLSDYITDKL